MSKQLQIITPVDGSVYAERPLASGDAARVAVEGADKAQKAWYATPIEERQRILSDAVDRMVAEKDSIAEELAWTMGRPVSAGAGEVGGFEERARYMIDVAPEALKDIVPPEKSGFRRYIRREPVGVVVTVAPWNFPYMTAVNSIWPALAAGNAVILKHAAQTVLAAERMARVLAEAGLPDGVFQALHMDHATAAVVMQAPPVRMVCFTGSVGAGHAVQRTLAEADGFPGAGLELGGKDPAYVRADADIAHAAAGIADGGFFNSGQSCCGIERVYVHASVYDDFVERLCTEVRGLKLGNPLEPATTLGPLVKPEAADFARGQVNDAVAAGARALIDPAEFPADGGAYMAPQVLVDVDHSMRVMTEETFGPVVGIMKVDDDDQAIDLMNDSEFGLTAAIWTRDADTAERLGQRIETGTVYMNRCDYLDPALAWTGVKHTGRGCTLSVVGYESLTRPKSFHLRLNT
ncbi:MAG: aldehyde dehydrogenase family protein [Halofilum sp. (in: g-proteobacteria)]